MKAAIIGLGVIGKVHYDVLKRQGEDIVALCDIDAAKLNGYDNVKKYFDYKKMLDEEQIDVVHICTPHYLHADMTIYALERNVNVLCEKPLCIRKEDVARIIDAENKSEAMLGVCLQNRYNKSSQFVKGIFKTKKSISLSATCCGIATRRITRRENGGARKKPKAAECLSIRQYIRSI